MLISILTSMPINSWVSDPMIFNMFQAVPKQEIIRFADPLTDITRITLEFKNPDTPIRIVHK